MTHFETFVDAFSALDANSRLLDGDYVVIPPSKSSGYESTPKNALTFAEMGVDGVHFAVLTRNGSVRDDSPVVQVSPMDSEDVHLMAESFLEFLAVGCGVSMQQIDLVFAAERAGGHALVPFVTDHFQRSRFFSEEREVRRFLAGSE
jgi:hypothetical protein